MCCAVLCCTVQCCIYVHASFACLVTCQGTIHTRRRYVQQSRTGPGDSVSACCEGQDKGDRGGEKAERETCNKGGGGGGWDVGVVVLEFGLMSRWWSDSIVTFGTCTVCAPWQGRYCTVQQTPYLHAMRTVPYPLLSCMFPSPQTCEQHVRPFFFCSYSSNKSCIPSFPSTRLLPVFPLLCKTLQSQPNPTRPRHAQPATPTRFYPHRWHFLRTRPAPQHPVHELVVCRHATNRTLAPHTLLSFFSFSPSPPRRAQSPLRKRARTLRFASEDPPCCHVNRRYYRAHVPSEGRVYNVPLYFSRPAETLRMR